MEILLSYESDRDHLKATELKLGLPGSDEPSPNTVRSRNKRSGNDDGQDSAPPPKAQIVGWPPIRSYRKNRLQAEEKDSDCGGIYVKVSMDGAPYMRKIDVMVYKCYPELLKGLENMFKLTIGKYSEREGYDGSEYAPTYEDKDGDWMLVGDVPWDMFITSCKRLRIMRGSEAKGLACV